MATSDDQIVTSVSPVQLIASLTFVSGLWLFVSPWIYGAYYNADSWNDFIVGLVIASMAAITFSSGRRFRLFRWLTGLLGTWCFASPWVFSYTDNTGRFANGLSVGVVLFVLALID